jgi:hypothetical protein
MPTLAKVTEETRSLLKLLGIAVVVGIIFYFLFQGVIAVKNIVAPPPPTPPENKFGNTLPHVSFPIKTFDKLNYKINTVSGTLPQSPDRIKIYKTLETPPDINALGIARNTLANANFKLSERKISDTVFSFANENGTQIAYDIYTKSFTINSNYLQNPSTFENIGNRKDIVRLAVISFIDSLGIDKSDINLQKTAFTFYKIENGKLVKTTNQAQSQIALVSLFQNDIDTIAINYPSEFNSVMNFYVGIVQNKPEIVAGNFTHTIVNSIDSSTYLIKTVNQAFEDLKKGNAYMVENAPDVENIDITNVTLGYYIGATAQPYLVPIFIFEGKDFKAYVQALPDTTLTN